MARPISVSIPHELGAVEAKKRIDDGFVRLMSQVGQGMAKIDKTWTGDRMAFTVQAIGQTVTGHLDVKPQTIDLELYLPAFLAAIADKIKGRLRKEGQILLGKK
jgi:hypothetical protein